MTWFPTAQQLVLGAYVSVLIVLSVYGLHRVLLLSLLRRHPDPVDTATTDEVPDQDLPVVTVQLPIFNERYVVDRLIDAVARLDWPRGRLEIQVLDDSTDDTVRISRAAAARWREQGIDIQVLHRTDRVGFKAGALEAGLAIARGELIAVFDADFVPPQDFLRRTVPHFGPRVGMVQARWGHLNDGESGLTRGQAILLDGHFVVEHGARFRSGRWFNFNGTAGIWRPECIRDAGGWQHDTLTEDLDLSYRAQLAGWDFVYLPEVVAPAELPPTMLAFKGQQHRWAKGSIQTLRKLSGRIRSAAVPWPVRLEALIHLANNLAYPLVLLLTLLTPVAIWIRAEHLEAWLLFDLLVFTAATVGVLLFYTASQWAIRGDWRRQVVLLPAALALGIGMAVNQTRAVAEALIGHRSPFVRTPKAGARGTIQLPRSAWSAVEVAIGLVHVAAIGWAIHRGAWASVPLAALMAAGFLYVGAWGSLRKGSSTTRAPVVSGGAEVAGIPQARSSSAVSQPATSKS